MTANTSKLAVSLKSKGAPALAYQHWDYTDSNGKKDAALTSCGYGVVRQWDRSSKILCRAIGSTHESLREGCSPSPSIPRYHRPIVYTSSFWLNEGLEE